MKTLNIMIIDDNPIDRAIMRYQLEQFGIERIVECDGANKALVLLMEPAFSESSSTYDIIMLDLQMPNMDGVSFLQEFSKLLKKGRIQESNIIINSATQDQNELSNIEHYPFVKGFTTKGVTTIDSFKELVTSISDSSSRPLGN